MLYRRTRELEGCDESPTAAIIDSQSVKTGAEARDTIGFDAGKRVKGRKRHLVTDTLGLMLRIEVHSAGVQDRDGAALVLDLITRRSWSRAARRFGRRSVAWKQVLPLMA